jgi:ATP-dependent protease ClpP protease subunit
MICRFAGIFEETREDPLGLNRTAQESESSALDDPDFTPNADRAIWVQGRLDDSLLTRLIPQIVTFVQQNRSPITVFIDSRGGNPYVALTILTLLKWPDPRDNSRCRVITVAQGRAASAAAQLLAGGDFAIAYPASKLHYHGSGGLTSERLTADIAQRAAMATALQDEQLAASLARLCLRRLMFIASSLRPTFHDYRAKVGKPELTDLQCFQEVLPSKVSPMARRVLRVARGMRTRSEGLINRFLVEIRGGRPSTRVGMERLMLNASIAFEIQRQKSLLSAAGLSRINQHCFFLREFVGDEQGEHVPNFCDGGEKGDTYFLELWPFLISIYRALGKNENALTPVDAMWLGLIDTVRPG